MRHIASLLLVACLLASCGFSRQGSLSDNDIELVIGKPLLKREWVNVDISDTPKALLCDPSHASDCLGRSVSDFVARAGAPAIVRKEGDTTYIMFRSEDCMLNLLAEESGSSGDLLISGIIPVPYKSCQLEGLDRGG